MSGLTYDEPTRELVAGKYQLTRLLGRGGMGSVWEGVHCTLGTRVAVKFIESAYADSADARSRFENEARAAARLVSKHVVKVFDHGLMPDGRPYIVMEFLGGEPLDNRLERVGRLPFAETLRIVQQVARALTKAHAAGIVHRDLKPENVFLVWDDEDGADIAKVVDFGIAKFTNSNAGISSSTRTGSVLGTPYYMSPEQARGLRSVDARTDLWALGVIVYRCVVGELPFTGEAVGDLLVKICTAPFPVPTQVAPGIPPGFDSWFVKALDREPDRRFQTAAELADSLALAFGASVPPSVAYGSPRSDQNSQLPGQPFSPNRVAQTTPLNVQAAQSGGLNYVGTGGAFSQTPATEVPKQGRGGLVAAALAGGALLALLGIGGVAFYAVGPHLFGGAVPVEPSAPGTLSLPGNSSAAHSPVAQSPTLPASGHVSPEATTVATSGSAPQPVVGGSDAGSSAGAVAANGNPSAAGNPSGAGNNRPGPGTVAVTPGARPGRKPGNTPVAPANPIHWPEPAVQSQPPTAQVPPPKPPVAKPPTDETDTGY